MTCVRGFGAKGDGCSDDTDALLRAFREGDGQLVLEPGTYRITRPLEVSLADVGPVGISGAKNAALPLLAASLLAKGETVLVHGAAGGVGLAAVEIAMAVGARVIAVANGDEKQAILRDRGVEHVIATDGFREKVEEIAGGNGLDVVYDPVGGPVSRPSISCLRPGGRLVTIGYAAGEIPSITFNVLLVKNISVMGFNWGEYVGWSPVDRREQYAAAVAEIMQTLLGWWQEGKIRPTVHAAFDLADFRDAMRGVRGRRAIGRVVLTP